MATSKTQDTEITLDVGKMLVLFLGLAALCGVFFGLGYSFGKKSVSSAPTETPVQSAQGSGIRPSATKSNTSGSSQSNLTFYKAVNDTDSNAQLAKKDAATPPASSEPSAGEDQKPPTPDPTTAPQTGSGYFVQVAAVSKQEDAEALVDALKKKQYPAFVANAPDKLFHVQVGPYTDVKEAETLRSKLVSDGYNPILKK